MMRLLIRSIIAVTLALSISGSGFVINPFSHGSADSLLTNLIAWWSLNEASGTRSDSHTNILDLTDQNTVTQATGKVGDAADFEVGTSEYLDRASSDAVLNPSGNFTCSCWVKFESVGQTMTLLGKWDATGDQRGWRLQGNADAEVRFLASDDGEAGPTQVLWGSDFSAGVWYFVVGYYDGTDIGITVDDGTPVTATFAGPIHAATADFVMGASGNSSGIDTLLDGILDECNVYSRKLSAAEITRLYNSGNGIAFPG